VDEEELYTFSPSNLLIYIDFNDNISPSRRLVREEKGLRDRKKPRPLQEILLEIELAFKEFLNKICK